LKWLDKIKWIFKGDKAEGPSKEVDDINKRLKLIEEILKEIKKKPLKCHITIEEINLDNLQLENLIFNLEKIDVKELSGALNIGNNFGVTVNKEGKKNDKKKDKKIKRDLSKKVKIKQKNENKEVLSKELQAKVEDKQNTKTNPIINKRYIL
jgi:hypothetical protein